MQLGYLSREGHLVTVDTLGTCHLFRAYRIDVGAGRLEFLGIPRPTETVEPVQVTVELHRKGWGAPGEVVVKRLAGTLLRTRTYHAIVGGTWKAIRPLYREALWAYGGNVSPARPLLSTRPPVVRRKGTFPPGRKAPCIVLFHDASVKAVRREGARVRVYATELTEFTGFFLGKLEALIEFPTEAGAEEFARHFPRIENPATLDATARIEVDRSRKRVLSRGRKAAIGGAIAAAILVTLGLLVLLAPVMRANPGVRSGIQGGLTVFGIVSALGILSALRASRVERVDLSQKWPRTEFERWCKEAPGHGPAMVPFLKEIGVVLDPLKGTLEPLDRFLRAQPPDTFFGSLALDLSALVGAFVLAEIGRPVAFEWRLPRDPGHPVLSFPAINLWISPLSVVRSVWEEKGKETLDDFVRSCARQVQMAMAFRQITEVVGLGFLSTGWEDFEGLESRLSKDLAETPAESKVVGESHYRSRAVRYAPFEILFIEVETAGPTGPRFVPLYAIPSCDVVQTVHGQIEGGPPRTDLREDLALVRLEGAELVPIGVQVRNFLDVGPGFGERKGRLAIELRAVADEARVVSPRMRETRPEAKDFLAPMEPTPEGTPQNPYANFLGRVASLRELVNPLTRVPLWGVGLDITGFRLEVVVRKDRCDGMPQVGQYLTGSVWLLADLEAPKSTPSPYIR